jgi:phage/plasmid-associated DNA primase
MLSFNNGVFLLDTCEFVRDPEQDLRTNDRVARHYIASDLNIDNTDTPLLDAVVRYQMSEDCYEFLKIMIGRLFFKVGEHDSWQVLPMLYGYSGTGKSTLIGVIQEMFARDSIGIISSTHEPIFGLESIYEKELIICDNAPKEMSKVLSQQLWESMVMGENVLISRKRKPTISKDWEVPMIWAGNNIPDYEDTLAPKLMLFKFHTLVPTRIGDTGLKARIIETELPSIVYKCITSYKNAVEQHANSSVWQWCPREMRNNQ